jgi:hypothetical protein
MMAEEAKEEGAGDDKSALGDGEKSVAVSQKSAAKSRHSDRKGNEISSLTNMSVIPERNNIEDDFKDILLKLWRQISGNYSSQMK